jgi:hypothetical protein
MRQRVVDLETQVFTTATTSTILYRLNAVVSQSSTLNTQVIVGGAGTVRQRVVDLETQVYSNVASTVLYRIVQIEAKNTAQDTSITYLRPNDNIADVGVYDIPIILALSFSTARVRLSAQFYMQLTWGRELGAIRASPVTQVCLDCVMVLFDFVYRAFMLASACRTTGPAPQPRTVLC